MQLQQGFSFCIIRSAAEESESESQPRESESQPGESESQPDHPCESHVQINAADEDELLAR